MNGTFTQEGAGHSLRARWLMEAQQKLEIGERIRELRENSAETNRSIAEYVGVGERSVAAWVAGDGIAYDNAKKVAELFQVDVDWIWRGREKGATPDLIGELDGISELREQILGLRTDVAELGVDLARDKAQERKWQRRVRESGS